MFKFTNVSRIYGDLKNNGIVSKISYDFDRLSCLVTIAPSLSGEYNTLAQGNDTSLCRSVYVNFLC